MTPSEFITELFGHGWKREQLPVFLETMRRMSEDAQRYYELREALAKHQEWIATRESLNSVDDHIDSVRQSGYP
jgi:hypothetical protein